MDLNAPKLVSTCAISSEGTYFSILLEIFSVCLHIPFGAKATVEDTIGCSKSPSVLLTIFRLLLFFVCEDFLWLVDDAARQDCSRIELVMNKEVRCTHYMFHDLSVRRSTWKFRISHDALQQSMFRNRSHNRDSCHRPSSQCKLHSRDHMVQQVYCHCSIVFSHSSSYHHLRSTMLTLLNVLAFSGDLSEYIMLSYLVALFPTA